MSIFSLNKNIFEETHIENTQLQTDLSNLQFQYLVQEDDNLPLSEISEIFEISENNLLENEIWTEEELSKFKKLYYKEKDTFEKQDDDNQKLENEINLLQNNDFKTSFEKVCCEKNCLQTQVEYSVALKRYLNFKNLSKPFQDMYLLGIIATTKRPEIIKTSKKSKLTTEYSFEGKSICKNAFKTIYSLGDTRWKNLRDHFVEYDINLRIDSKTGKVGNRAISFEKVIKVITFIGNFAKQNGLPSPGRSFRDNTIAIIYLPADTTYSSLHIQYLETIKTNNQFEVGFTTFVKIWKKFLPHIKKLTPRSDLCLKCKNMRFNAIYWSNEEKETKVLEWHEHIKWAYEERENYK
ncbi:299_t:CDS:2 [Scutellospora calospora]|uniref:299_t:CDS:1 n=1 Tax=Scutellospora calospora TaxID=85575 RepID=A0ACA9JY58_9GLOM|nr:299_t:CDS:2 [Scutellospora calospora]